MKWTTALTVLILIVTLAGCCTEKTVMVPVSSCPAPPVISMPTLAVEGLPPKPETAAALKALAVDHITLKSTLEQCITTLDGYRSN